MPSFPQAAALVIAIAAALGLVAYGATTNDRPPPALDADVVRFGANAATADPFEFVFDESVVQTYDLTVTDDDWAWLNDNPLLEQYVPSSLAFAGLEFDQVGVRYKGAFGGLRFCFDLEGNQTCDKLSFKLKFNEYDARGRFFGLKRLNLHSMNGDPTKLHDALSYGLFREAGIAAPRTAFAWLTINGDPQGLFVVIEEIDDRFVAANFPDGGDGNLYKEIWPEHLDPQRYLAALDTTLPAADEPNVDKIQRFAADLLAAEDDAARFQALSGWTDIDRFVTQIAVDRFVDHWDGIFAWYCVETDRTDARVVEAPCFNHNYFWYENARADRLTLIPWDLDHSFEYPSPIESAYRMPAWNDLQASCDLTPVFLEIPARAPACDPLLRTLLTAGWDTYVTAAQTLLDDPAFQVEAIQDRIDSLAALIEDRVAEDPNALSLSQWRRAVADLRRDIVPMYDAFASDIEPPVHLDHRCLIRTAADPRGPLWQESDDPCPSFSR